jgi:hypothetical protein
LILVINKKSFRFLKNKFEIIKDETSLIRLAERLYEQKHRNLKHNKYKIKENGTDVYHLVNLAKYFRLSAFSKSQGSLRNIKFLIDQGIWPIIHRPFERDGDGHYLLVIDYNKHYFILFDPAKKHRYLALETSKGFYKKWKYKNERWFIFFYKNKFMIPFKGKYL